MSGDIAAAGDMMMGALAARAVEPGAGEAPGRGPAGALCLNCGTGLIGAHCHRCGQSAHVHRSVGAIGHELLHGVFHFEGKAFRTLPMLLFRPGELTRRYVAGERARFVSPLAIFLFTVFLTFAVLGALGSSAVGGGSEAGLADPATPQQRLIRAERRLRDAEAGLAAASAGQRAAAEKTVAEQREKVIERRQAVAEAKAGDGPLDVPKTGWARLDKGVEKANKNPGLLAYKLQNSAYKYSWLLIILSTPVVALLFLWRRRFGLYDHAVFVTYSLTFMMLFVVVLILADTAGASDGAIATAATVLPPLHIYKQLRGAYSLRRSSALWRTMVLVVFAGGVLLAWFLLLLVQGLTG